MDYLSDGMSAALSRLSNLQVMASSTVARYKARQDDPQGVGRELHVDAVLTGRVAEHGNKLDVEAELVNITKKVTLGDSVLSAVSTMRRSFRPPSRVKLPASCSHDSVGANVRVSPGPGRVTPRLTSFTSKAAITRKSTLERM